jgi:hypothetical protein
MDVALDLRVLGHGLHDHVAAGQLGQLRDHARVLHPLPGALGRALAARPDHHLVVLRGRPRQPAGDRPATDYPECVSHWIDWSVNRVG